MRKALAQGLLVCLATLFTFGLLEIGVRVTFGVPLFISSDLRPVAAETNETATAIYDPLLGWTMRPGIAGTGFNTMEYGIRKNSGAHEPIAEGGMLAVGDSFTAGSEVVDEETWPAHLARMTRERVFNAGVGGYGTDQIVLNAERLIPLLKPKVVLVGMLVPDDIQRAGYSSYGRPKPYFVREDGAFEHRHQPVPVTMGSDSSLLRGILSRSMIFNVILSRMRPDWWLSGVGGQRYERIGNNPVAVTCYLLERLQQTLSAAGIRGMVIMQHGGWMFARKQARSAEADAVARCAEEAGFEIVDEYDNLKAVAEQSIDELKRHYVMHDNGATYGHMSSQGNENIARLIADRLRQPVTTARHAGKRVPIARTPGDGLNRLAGIAAGDFEGANATVRVAGAGGPVVGVPVLRIAATDVPGEHYVVSRWSGAEPGVYTLSVYVREQPEGAVRLQLLDTDTNGVIVDYSYGTGLFDIFKIGNAAQVDFVAEPAPDGWARLVVVAELRAEKGTAIFQLIPKAGVTTFQTPAVELLLQAPMVERGQLPSRFCNPGACEPQPTAPSPSRP